MSSYGLKVSLQVGDAVPDSWTIFWGFIAGSCSFIFGYVLTYALEGQRIFSPTRPLIEFYFSGIDSGMELNVGPAGPLPGAHQFAAWQYLTMHGASFEHYLQTTGFEFPLPNVWTLAPPKTVLLVFVPAVLLFTAGGIVVSRRRTDDPWIAAKRGGAVALGYLPLVVLLALATQWVAPVSVAVEHFGVTTSGPEPVGTMSVATLPVALIAGLAYPIAFGSVGGYVAFLWSQRTWPTGPITRGVLAGGVAFLIGWGLTVGRSVVRAGQADHWQVDARGPEGWASVGLDPGAFRVGTWQFHRLHEGTIGVRYVGTVTDGIDAISLPDLTLGPTGLGWFQIARPLGAIQHVILGDLDLWFVLVPGLLVVAGAVVTVWAAKRGQGSAVGQGATVALGYLPLSLVTALLVTETTTGSVRAVIGVEFVDAFLLTGLVFPVTFGVIGGIIAHGILAVR